MFFANLWHATPSEKTTIIRYFTPDSDYKDYCRKGRVNSIPVLECCPLCGGYDCLIGHGWYKKKSFYLVVSVIMAPI